MTDIPTHRNKTDSITDKQTELLTNRQVRPQIVMRCSFKQGYNDRLMKGTAIFTQILRMLTTKSSGRERWIERERKKERERNVVEV